MRSDWIKSTIAEVCSLVTDGSHFSPRSVDAGKFMVSVKDFTPDGFDFTSCRLISEEDYMTLEKNGCVPEYNDILIGKDGARFFEDIVIYRQSERPALLSSIAILRCNTTKIIPEFLYYTLKTPTFRADVRENYGSGSAIPRIILKDFKRMPVLVPPMETQQVIADMLSSLDARIALNRKINHHLEQIAQAIWSERFGDLEPNGSLGDIIELFDFKRVPLSSNQRGKMEKVYPYYGAAALMDYVDNYLFDGTYLLLGEDGTVIDGHGFPTLQYVWGRFWVNNHAHILQGRNGFTVESLYTLLKQTSVTSIVTGAVQPKINQANLKALPVVVPNEEKMQEFNDLIAPLFGQIRENCDENLRLEKLRATLLPRLMSGELSVSNLSDTKR